MEHDKYLGTDPVEVVHYFTVKQYLFIYLLSLINVFAVGTGTSNELKILGQMDAERLILLAFSSREFISETQL